MTTDRASLRLGCVKYLNAWPLIHSWNGKVMFDHPSALCARLARGELDVALVSSFEFLRNPIYRIVDDVSISSDGPVYSVFVAHQDDVPELKEIEIDTASQTSANLLRCLLADPEHRTGILPVGRAAVSPARSHLVIGDQAIRFRREHEKEFQFWDLGEAWKRIVDLPFVYALWLIRPEVANASAIAETLRALRDRNLRNIDSLAAQQTDFPRDFCHRYWTENIRFSFGEEEKKGLRTFADLCAKHDLLPKRELVFDLV